MLITNMTYSYILRVILVVFLAYGCGQLEEKPKPNILWILAEDLSPDLGCFGLSQVKTPVLDQLAAEGVRYTNVFTTAGICTPSRTALAVGMHQTSINAHHMRYPTEMRNALPEDILPINEIFRRNGYQTANIKGDVGTGKTDWSFKSELNAYDHQSWNEFDQEKPFFAVVNLRLTHRPFEKDEKNPINPNEVKVPPYYPDHPVARQDWADYLESAQLMDSQVGEVLQVLEEKGWSENTIVYFFSDHGRPFTRGKSFLYDSGIEIPLIIKCPSGLRWHDYLPNGSVNDQLLSSLDIVATSLSMAGIPKPAQLQGNVFLGENAEAERDFIYATADRSGEVFFKSRAVRSNKYKYIRNYNNGFSINEASTAYRKANHPIYHLLNILAERDEVNEVQRKLIEPLPEEELYDIIADSFEIRNLAGEPAFEKELQAMRDRLAEWQKETTDYGMQEDPEALANAFEVYGKESFEKNEKRILEQRARVLQQLN
ncbi:MAG: sulfatase [Cyclobacteriaceae bacterium]|nr:sulfatase [Cyclobacteriaceae bacterium SS2]